MRKTKTEELTRPANATRLVYDGAQWDAFVTMLDRPEIDPQKEKPRLKRLLVEPSILERRLKSPEHLF